MTTLIFLLAIFQKTGDLRHTVEEPLGWVEEYPIQWREPSLNLAELAKLRWEDGLKINEIARKLGRTESCIKNGILRTRRNKLKEKKWESKK